MVEVRQYRCLSCGASELIQRDVQKRFEKYEPKLGQASPLDGRAFAASPYIPEEG